MHTKRYELEDQQETLTSVGACMASHIESIPAPGLAEDAEHLRTLTVDVAHRLALGRMHLLHTLLPVTGSKFAVYLDNLTHKMAIIK